MPKPSTLSRNSRFIENLLSHRFIFDISRHLLCQEPEKFISVLRAEVDNSGIDIVLQLGTVTRHIQMKTSSKKKNAAKYAIQESLERIPGACVIWMCYNPVDMEPIHYHMLGGRGNGKMKMINHLPLQEKRRRDGSQIPRVGYRLVTIGYANLQGVSLSELATRLFALKR